MGYNHQEQHFTEAGIAYQTTGDAKTSNMRAMGCQRIYQSGGQWYRYDHAAGTTPVAIDTVYDPQFTVRYIKVEGSNVQLHYDMPFDRGVARTNQAQHCLDQFAANVLHKVQVTRVYLDVNTTCDAVTLYY